MKAKPYISTATETERAHWWGMYPAQHGYFVKKAEALVPEGSSYEVILDLSMKLALEAFEDK